MTMPVRIEVNGRAHEREVEPRRTLADFLRDDLNLTGTHVACEHGFCGTCNVLLDGETIRSCLLFAVQADGRSVETVEGSRRARRDAGELQQAFTDHHALQCGFCTPAMLLTAPSSCATTPARRATRRSARRSAASPAAAPATSRSSRRSSPRRRSAA